MPDPHTPLTPNPTRVLLGARPPGPRCQHCGVRPVTRATVDHLRHLPVGGEIALAVYLRWADVLCPACLNAAIETSLNSRPGYVAPTAPEWMPALVELEARYA